MSDTEICNICANTDENLQCHDCGVKCCYKCLSIHRENFNCKTLKDKKFHLCKSHNGEIIKRYCQTCSKLACEKCIKEHHINHQDVCLKEAIFSRKGEISDLLVKLREEETSLKDFINTFPEKEKRFKTLETKLKDKKHKWTDLIERRIADEIHRMEVFRKEFDESCEKKENYRKRLEKIIVDVEWLQSNNFPLTFIPTWQSVCSELDQLESSRQAKLSDPSQPTVNFDTILKCDDFICCFDGESEAKDQEKDTNVMDARLREATVSEDVQSDNKEDKNPVVGESDAKDQEKEKNVMDARLKEATDLEDVQSDNKEDKNPVVGVKAESPSKQTDQLKSKITELEAQLKKLKEEQRTMLQLSEKMVDFVVKTGSFTTKDIESLKTKRFRLQSHKNEDINQFANNIETVSTACVQIKLSGLEFEIKLHEKLKDFAVWHNELEDDMKKSKRQMVPKETLIKFKNEIQAKEKEIKHLTESNAKKLQTLEEDCQKKIEKTRQQEIEKNKQLTKMKDEQTKFQQEKNRLENKVKDLENKLNSYPDKKLQEKDNEIIYLKEEIKTRETSADDFLKENVKTHERAKQLTELLKDKEEAITKMKADKEDLISRLSSIAGEKLTKGNPGITDLSDPKRPMKIGEKYGELYDNEWTDAMECIDFIKSDYPNYGKSELEEIVTRHLCRILRRTYQECVNISLGQCEAIQTFEETLLKMLCVEMKNEHDTTWLVNSKEIFAARKQTADRFVKYFIDNKILGQERILEDWDYEQKNEKLIISIMETDFYKTCVSLCWSMAVQDPVMHLDDEIKPGTKYDKTVYKEFVQSGNSVRFVVWPALFLNRNGPLLYKGVVQAYWEKENDTKTNCVPQGSATTV